jgi:hypothetical protein
VALVTAARLTALACIGLALAGGVAAASSQAEPVTLSTREYTNPTSKLRVYVWYGQIASNAAGEDVEILGRDCHSKGFRLFAATKTSPGGGYEVENAQPQPPYQIVDVISGTAFRARWRDQLSSTLLHKLPLPTVYVLQVPKKRAWRVIVNPAPVYEKMAGKLVVLQRQRGGKWVAYKQAKLVHKPTFEYGGATNHEARFEVPQRGLKLRALLPAKSAAPCYHAKATGAWRS